MLFSKSNRLSEEEIVLKHRVMLRIFLLVPGEMLLVSFQKSCMKKINPVPRVWGESAQIQLVKKSSCLVLNPLIARQIWDDISIKSVHGKPVDFSKNYVAQ